MKNKKNIVLGALVAVLGTSVAMGTSYALYSVTPTDQVIHIGANTNQDIELVVGEVTNAGETDVVSPESDHVFDFDIGFNKPVNSTYTQSVYAAKLTVTITSENDALLQGLVSANSGFKVDPDKAYYGDYWGGTAGEAKFVAGTGSVVASVTVPIDETVDLDTKVTLSLSGMDGNTFATTVADATYNISIDLTAPDAGFVAPYIVGSMSDSVWSAVDKYMMVPDPKNAEFIWMYETKTGIFNPGDEMKGWKAADGDDGEQWSKGNNWVYGTNINDNQIIGWTGYDSGSLYPISR